MFIWRKLGWWNEWIWWKANCILLLFRNLRNLLANCLFERDGVYRVEQRICVTVDVWGMRLCQTATGRRPTSWWWRAGWTARCACGTWRGGGGCARRATSSPRRCFAVPSSPTTTIWSLYPFNNVFLLPHRR